MPAPPPAAAACQLMHRPCPRILAVPIRLVAAEAGFFLSDPLTLFADILKGARRRRGNGKGQWQRVKGQEDQEFLAAKRPQLRTSVDKQKMRGISVVRDHSDHWKQSEQESEI